MSKQAEIDRLRKTQYILVEALAAHTGVSTDMIGMELEVALRELEEGTPYVHPGCPSPETHNWDCGCATSDAHTGSMDQVHAGSILTCLAPDCRDVALRRLRQNR